MIRVTLVCDGPGSDQGGDCGRTLEAFLVITNGHIEVRRDHMAESDGWWRIDEEDGTARCKKCQDAHDEYKKLSVW